MCCQKCIVRAVKIFGKTCGKIIRIIIAIVDQSLIYNGNTFCQIKCLHDKHDIVCSLAMFELQIVVCDQRTAVHFVPWNIRCKIKNILRNIFF